MARHRTLAGTLPTWRRVAHHVGPALRHERPLIALTFGGLLAETALRILEPWPLKFVFDVVLMPRQAHPEWTWLAGRSPETVIAVAAAAVLLVTALRAGAAYIGTVGGAIVGNRVVSGLRERLYTHLQQLPLSFHARARAGDLTVRLVGDVGVMKDVAVTALLPLAANLLILAGMAIVMAWFNWELALVALALLPLVALATRRLGRRIHQTARDQRRHEGALAGRAAESIVAARLVRALSLEQEFGRSFRSDSRGSLKEGVRGKRLEARLERTADVLVAAATAAVLWAGAHLALAGRMTPGDLLVFLAYLKTGFRPVADFAKYSGRLAKAAAAADRVLDVLDEAPDDDGRSEDFEARPLEGAVRFDRVSFAYEPGRPALAEVSFDVAPGATVFVIGPSGSGKTTLVSLLMRLYPPDAGTVRIDGRDLRDLGGSGLRRQFGVVLQDTVLFAGTVRENISCGLEVADADVVEAAQLADAHEFISRLPLGYDTPVGERGVTFSAGQRQRIAIARAAIRRAPLLVLDEPTTGLDDGSKAQVMQALDRLAEGRTTFFITHEVVQSASRADLVLWIQDGRVAEAGAPDALMAADGHYARALREALDAGREGRPRALAG